MEKIKRDELIKKLSGIGVMLDEKNQTDSFFNGALRWILIAGLPDIDGIEFLLFSNIEDETHVAVVCTDIADGMIKAYRQKNQNETIH